MIALPTSDVQHCVWDFNGTILDDLSVTVESINTLMRERGMREITVNEHRMWFRFPVSEYYEDLGFDFSREAFDSLSDEYHELYMGKLERCGLYEGIAGVIRVLARKGIRQYVLSAMHEPTLIRCCRALGILDYFDAVYGLADFLARSKTARGRRLCDDFGISPGSALYIGDTEHDMEVASELGLAPVAAAWGHQAPGKFDAGAVTLCEHPQELAETIAV
ncbi:MAG: HAD family hydrolase [Spirochaetales bacterium]